MIVLDRAQVRERIDLDAVRHAVREAFLAHARGEATPPAVLHLDLGPERGDLHVKGAWCHGAPTFTIEVAGSFPAATELGLPSGQGLSLVFDARTGVPMALLDDGGWLTEVRTAAAGALAVDALAPSDVARLAVLGTGSQARAQLEAIARVRSPASVAVWGRREEAADRVAAFARDALGLAAVSVSTVARAVGGADVVVTVTAARRPIVAAEAVEPAALVVAVGADTPGKQELDPRLVEGAALLVVDDAAQCAAQGELQHVADPPAHVSLGEVLAGSLRRPRHGRVVVDLTGLGVQDAAVGALVLA